MHLWPLSTALHPTSGKAFLFPMWPQHPRWSVECWPQPQHLKTLVFLASCPGPRPAASRRMLWQATILFFPSLTLLGRKPPPQGSAWATSSQDESGKQTAGTLQLGQQGLRLPGHCTNTRPSASNCP